MKKIIALLVVFLPVLAVAVGQDKIKMVGLFPTPYMSYDELRDNGVERLRVGMAKVTRNDSFNEMILGTSGGPLALDVNILNVTQGATLFLNGRDAGTSSQVHIDKRLDGRSYTTDPVLTFRENLYLENPNNTPAPSDPNHDPLGSLQADTVVVKNWKLFHKKFPECNDKIRWGSMTPKGDTKQHIFLFCGPVPDPESCPNCWHWQAPQCHSVTAGTCNGITIHDPVGSSCEPGTPPESGFKSCTGGGGGKIQLVDCKWVCQRDQECFNQPAVQNNPDCKAYNDGH